MNVINPFPNTFTEIILEDIKQDVFDKIISKDFEIELTKILPLKIRKKIILCDRFIYDTLIDLMISIKDYELIDSRISKLFLNLIPKKNSTIIMFMSNENILRSRRLNIKHDKNLNIKIKLYKKISFKYHIKLLNTNNSFKKIQKINLHLFYKKYLFFLLQDRYIRKEKPLL